VDPWPNEMVGKSAISPAVSRAIVRLFLRHDVSLFGQVISLVPFK
jgi:hypothetical protein